MLVRVKMIGAGKFPDDPFRADLPTYNEVLTLHDQALVYAIIPDGDHPALNDHESAKFEATGHGPALIALSASAHSDWYEHLDKSYSASKRKFRPEVA